ncbi:MAG TPA: carbon-nitrogen hydrolase family protein [Longimicrobiales bacterium]|nr:carbon-nitrogen hydrolase family protein [Longimicrobiales bacterium]
MASSEAGRDIAGVAEGAVRIAVVQPRGRPFDTPGAVDEVVHRVEEAAGGGARLVLLPEAFVGGYPWGLAFGTAVGGRSDAGRRAWQRYHDSAIAVPGPETARMGEAAARAGVFLAVGVVERDTTYSGGTLFCTLLYFGTDGTLLGKHRKLKPTAAERLIWGEGDGSTLPVFDSPAGRVGGLICWENYMPLARMAMYGKGVEVYLAPTADARERWQSTLRHIALEGRCFVLGCNQVVARADYPDDLELAEELTAWPEALCRGGSAVYDPAGTCIAGPLYDEDGVLFADLEAGAVTRGKFDFDVTGHYARPDVFRFEVDERRLRPVGRVRSDRDD